MPTQMHSQRSNVSKPLHHSVLGDPENKAKETNEEIKRNDCYNAEQRRAQRKGQRLLRAKAKARSQFAASSAQQFLVPPPPPPLHMAPPYYIFQPADIT
eukprot:2978128-Amphidinium_carterae.1